MKRPGQLQACRRFHFLQQGRHGPLQFFVAAVELQVRTGCKNKNTFLPYQLLRLRNNALLCVGRPKQKKKKKRNDSFQINVLKMFQNPFGLIATRHARCTIAAARPVLLPAPTCICLAPQAAH